MHALFRKRDAMSVWGCGWVCRVQVCVPVQSAAPAAPFISFLHTLAPSSVVLEFCISNANGDPVRSFELQVPRLGGALSAHALVPAMAALLGARARERCRTHVCTSDMLCACPSARLRTLAQSYLLGPRDGCLPRRASARERCRAHVSPSVEGYTPRIAAHLRTQAQALLPGSARLSSRCRRANTCLSRRART